MDALLIAALEAAAPVDTLLVTVVLDSGTVRWTNGVDVAWDSETYRCEDPVYGRLGGISEIEDGADGQATVCDLTVLCDAAAMALWIDPAEQGALVTVHLGALSRSDGTLSGEPDLLFRGELDLARLSSGATQGLVIECITEEARMLEPNEGQRLSNAFQTAIFPADTAMADVTGVRNKVYWRRDQPNNAIK